MEIIKISYSYVLSVCLFCFNLFVIVFVYIQNHFLLFNLDVFGTIKSANRISLIPF